MVSDLRIGFLGAGKMATALAKGMVNGGLITAEQIIASDPIKAARDHFTRETGGQTEPENQKVIRFANVVVLAVKPHQIAPLLGHNSDLFTEKHLLLSIAAGVPLNTLEGLMPAGSRVIRIMPNTPAVVGSSASAFALGRFARAEDATLTEQLLSAVGIAYQLDEPLLDAVTGLSGSGPAYGFLMIEALSDGGVAAGLPRPIATQLAAQTLLGSAKMVIETGLHPGALKDMVTSPGGTTIEGLHELEKAGLRGALINAVRAASEKSRALGKSSNPRHHDH